MAAPAAAPLSHGEAAAQGIAFVRRAPKGIGPRLRGWTRRWKRRFRSGQFSSETAWPARCPRGRICGVRQTPPPAPGEPSPPARAERARGRVLGARRLVGRTPGRALRRCAVGGPPGRRSGPAPAGLVHPPRRECAGPSGCLWGASPGMRGADAHPAGAEGVAGIPMGTIAPAALVSRGHNACHAQCALSLTLKELQEGGIRVKTRGNQRQ